MCKFFCSYSFADFFFILISSLVVILAHFLHNINAIILLICTKIKCMTWLLKMWSYKWICFSFGWFLYYFYGALIRELWENGGYVEIGQWMLCVQQLLVNFRVEFFLRLKRLKLVWKLNLSLQFYGKSGENGEYYWKC